MTTACVGRVHLAATASSSASSTGVAALQERIPALDAGGIVDRPDRHRVAEVRERGRSRSGRYRSRPGTARRRRPAKSAAGHGRLEEQHRDVGVRERGTASSGPGENVESGTATAPASAAPNSAATASGRFPISTPTRAPFPSAAREQRLGDPPGLVSQVGVRPPHGRAVEQGIVEDERLVLGSVSGPLGEDAAERERKRGRMLGLACRGGPMSVDGCRPVSSWSALRRPSPVGRYSAVTLSATTSRPRQGGRRPCSASTVMSSS